jgi:hypothetical protein
MWWKRRMEMETKAVGDKWPYNHAKTAGCSAMVTILLKRSGVINNSTLATAAVLTFDRLYFQTIHRHKMKNRVEPVAFKLATFSQTATTH